MPCSTSRAGAPGPRSFLPGRLRGLAILLMPVLGLTACSSEPDRLEVRSQPDGPPTPPPGSGQRTVSMEGFWQIRFDEPLAPRIGNLDVPQPVGVQVVAGQVRLAAFRFGEQPIQVLDVDALDTVTVNQADGRLLLLSFDTVVPGSGERIRFDLAAGTTPAGSPITAPLWGRLQLEATRDLAQLRIDSDVTLDRPSAN